MAIRKNIEPGFVDVMLEGSIRTATLLERLERLDAATPWRELAAPILRLPEYNNAGAGRPTWDPVVMLKAMMLAKWFNLSDPGLEDALKDRISFRRFVGLTFDDATPAEPGVSVARDFLSANLVPACRTGMGEALTGEPVSGTGQGHRPG